MEGVLKDHTQSRKKSESAFAFISRLSEDREREKEGFGSYRLLFHNL
jgi:hypothetical protein